MRLNLPKPHLSPSSILLWKHSKQKFIDKYIFNIDGSSNAYTLYGKKFASWCETGEWDDASPLEKSILNKIVRYELREYELREDLKSESGDFTVFGKLDSYDPVKNRLRDQKTGTTAWSQSKVDSYFPIRLYAGLLYKKTGKMPKVYIDYIPTQIIKGEIYPTGALKIFQANLDVSDVLATLREACDIAESIHAWHLEYQKAAADVFAS